VPPSTLNNFLSFHPLPLKIKNLCNKYKWKENTITARGEFNEGTNSIDYQNININSECKKTTENGQKLLNCNLKNNKHKNNHNKIILRDEILEESVDNHLETMLPDFNSIFINNNSNLKQLKYLDTKNNINLNNNLFINSDLDFNLDFHEVFQN
jgi:hypothetical protein